MARTTLTAIAVGDPYATAPVEITWTAADVANGNDFTHTGREVLLVRNESADTAYDAIVHGPADPYGRTATLTFEVPFGEYHVFQRFPVVGWRQSNGRININGENADIEFAVLRLPSASE